MSRLFMLLLMALLVAGCGASEPPPQVSQSTKDLAVQSIKKQPEVLDAAIMQDGKRISLAIIVRVGTSQERARELGEDFVRQVKTFANDDMPGKTVGKGKYDYLVTVALPDKKEVASGAKVASAEKITW